MIVVLFVFIFGLMLLAAASLVIFWVISESQKRKRKLPEKNE